MKTEELNERNKILSEIKNIAKKLGDESSTRNR